MSSQGGGEGGQKLPFWGQHVVYGRPLRDFLNLLKSFHDENSSKFCNLHGFSRNTDTEKYWNILVYFWSKKYYWDLVSIFQYQLCSKVVTTEYGIVQNDMSEGEKLQNWSSHLQPQIIWTWGNFKTKRTSKRTFCTVNHKIGNASLIHLL